MAIEIEHKYLVKNDSWRSMSTGCHEIRQGYLSRRPESTVRVRIIDNKGILTVKGRNQGAKRIECEYHIPMVDALQLLDLCEGRVIIKKRHVINYEGFKWEIDEFDSDLSGLVLAEIELPSEDTQYPLPAFVGKNVTADPKYYNSNL